MGLAQGERPEGMRNPRDSMKSTWREDRKQWGLFHYIFHFTNLYGRDLGREVPKFKKTDPIPYFKHVACHRWISYHILWPMAIHQAIIWYTGKSLHPIAMFFLYSLAMQANEIHQIWVMRRLGHKYGYFDGDKHDRDEIPDHAILKVFNSLVLTTTIRPAFVVLLAYHRSQGPQFSWLLPIEIGVYAVVLDGWFYLYHRSCHELDSLWQYHRTHHLTKHPNPTLSSYADSEQEIIELALVPLLTYVTLKLMGFPMGFYDWWACHSYIIYTEAFGHSGLRLYASNTGPFSFLLEALGCELTIEDHDLHHRKGWRNSYNYGKQTRVWDRIFGTAHDRIEGDISNVDWNNKVSMPLY